MGRRQVAGPGARRLSRAVGAVVESLEARRLLAAPVVVESDFWFNTGPHRVRFAMDQPLDETTVTSSALLLFDLRNNTQITGIEASYLEDDPAVSPIPVGPLSNVASFRPSSGFFQTGNYEAVLLAGTVKNGNEEALEQDTPAQFLEAAHFHFMWGDINLDRMVTGDDWATLVSNFGMTEGATYMHGDLNYDGAVTGDDVAIMSTLLGTYLPPPPAAPNELTASSAFGPGRIDLNWQAPQWDLDGYRIWRSSDGGETWNLHAEVQNPNATHWYEEGLPDGAKYTYRIRAFTYEEGNSHTTNKVSAVTNLPGPWEATANLMESDAVTLIWTDTSGDEQGWDIWRSTDGISYEPWEQRPGTRGTGPMHHRVTGLDPGTQYWFRVRATTDAQISAWTLPVTIMTLEASNLAAPTNLSVVNVNQNVWTISWTDNEVDEEGYDIWGWQEYGPPQLLTTVAPGPGTGTMTAQLSDLPATVDTRIEVRAIGPGAATASSLSDPLHTDAGIGDDWFNLAEQFEGRNQQTESATVYLPRHTWVIFEFLHVIDAAGISDSPTAPPVKTFEVRVEGLAEPLYRWERQWVWYEPSQVWLADDQYFDSSYIVSYPEGGRRFHFPHRSHEFTVTVETSGFTGNPYAEPPDTGNYWELPWIGGTPILPVAWLETPGALEEGQSANLSVHVSPAMEPVVVNLSTAGTATAGDDYEPLPTNITLDLPSWAATIPLVTINDAAVEETERVSITLDPGEDYRRPPPDQWYANTQSIQIWDNEPTLNVTPTGARNVEGEPEHLGGFTFSLSSPAERDFDIPFSLSEQSTAEEEDFELRDPSGQVLSGSVPFQTGQQSVFVTLVPIDDDEPEWTETVILRVEETGWNYRIWTGSVEAKEEIVDDDLGLELSDDVLVAGEPRVALTLDVPQEVKPGAWVTLSAPENRVRIYTSQEGGDDVTNKSWIYGEETPPETVYVEVISGSLFEHDIAFNLFASDVLAAAAPRWATETSKEQAATGIEVFLRYREQVGDAFKILKDDELADSVLVGHRIELKAFSVVPPWGLGPQQWIVPGETFKAYFADREQAEVVLLDAEDLIADEIAFYWSDAPEAGIGYPVRFVVNVLGRTVTKRANFTVYEPAVSFDVLRLGKARVWDYFDTGVPYLQMVSEDAEGNVKSGIEIEATIDLPPLFVGGEWSFLQLVNLSHHFGEIPTTKNGQWLLDIAGEGPVDFGWAYPTVQPAYHGKNAGNGRYLVSLRKTAVALDSPGIALEGDDVPWGEIVAHLKMEAQLYVMFMPLGYGSEWVAVEVCDWEVSGWARLVDDEWEDWQQPDPPQPTTRDVTTNPTWTDNGLGVTWAGAPEQDPP